MQRPECIYNKIIHLVVLSPHNLFHHMYTLVTALLDDDKTQKHVDYFYLIQFLRLFSFFLIHDIASERKSSFVNGLICWTLDF